MSAQPMPAVELLANKADIKEVVAKAAQVIPTVFSMKNFIATNPLADMTDHSFEDAVKIAQQAYAGEGMTRTNCEMIKWCQQFFDDGQAVIKMPCRNLGFYKAWLDLCLYDDALHQHDLQKKAWLRTLPKEADAALYFVLKELEVSEDTYESYFQSLLAQLPGWAGYIKNSYRSQDPSRPATLVDFLAVYLATSYIFGESIRTSIRSKPSWLFDACEENFRKKLLEKLSCHSRLPTNASDVQLVFCIDTRSEPFRRKLERLGKYETFGFAGFFGLPVRIDSNDKQESKDCCPVLIKPEYTVQKSLGNAHSIKERALQALRKLSKTVQDKLKYNVVTPFAYVEACGPLYGVWMLLRTIAPKLAYASNERAIKRQAQAEVDLSSIPLRAQFQYAEMALRLMGLVDRFAPYVIFVGHGSCSENNPYFSSLDCGACGGNHGDINAKALALILNDRNIRQMLASAGIKIPRTTQFLAGLHNTTDDSVTLFDKPADCSVISQLVADLKVVQRKNYAARAKKLEGDTSLQQCNHASDTKCCDWSEVRPEWGLARAACFIAAPRALTKELNLDGRSFLHSYDWNIDKDGKLLETILTAPMVVAQWISSQYLFSTHDNQLFGSGSKVTHNVTGRLGVMQGNASDLQPGLPIQSVYLDDHTPYHEPMRLQVFAQAPRRLLESVISRQKILQDLFYNGWVFLTVLDPTDGSAYLLTREGSWKQEAT